MKGRWKRRPVDEWAYWVNGECVAYITVDRAPDNTGLAHWMVHPGRQEGSVSWGRYFTRLRDAKEFVELSASLPPEETK